MKVEVVDYRPEWAEMYAAEAEKIRAVLGENLIEIHHIGSTAVKGLKAKPIIDILAVVSDLVSLDGKNSEFEKAGYECMGEFGIRGRRYFRKGEEIRTHQIHAPCRIVYALPSGLPDLKILTKPPRRNLKTALSFC